MKDNPQPVHCVFRLFLKWTVAATLLGLLLCSPGIVCGDDETSRLAAFNLTIQAADDHTNAPTKLVSSISEAAPSALAQAAQF